MERIIIFFMVAVSFLWPWWPLGVAGVAFAAFSGRYAGAIALALLLDLAWGTPTGLLHYVLVPVTLFAFVLILLRQVSLRYFINKEEVPWR